MREGVSSKMSELRRYGVTGVSSETFELRCYCFGRGAETFAFDTMMGGGTETYYTSDATSICAYPYEEMCGAESICMLLAH